MASRGSHLINGGRGFATGAGLVGRLVAPLFARLVDQLDQRLAAGGMEGDFPDGSRRRVGFHAPGAVAKVDIRSWRALVRLATSGSVGWYQAWAAGEWTSPDPVTLFELFAANAVSLGDTARAKGPARWLNAAAHRLRDNAPRQARDNIAAHYDLGNDFYAAWLDEGLTYSSALFAKPDEDLAVARSSASRRPLDRLDLAPGDRLLEIGCGWGPSLIEAAKRGASMWLD